jgi:hypothetical protein
MRLTIAGLMLLTGCWGYSSVDNDGVCQPKKIHHNTPLICGDYDSVDVSLGVMRDGVGSMSTHDMTLSFGPNKEALEKKLEGAIAAGKLVNLKYNDRRFSWCQETEQVTDVEVIETTREVTEDAEQKKRDIQKQIEVLQGKLQGETK